jgi:Caulimovirus viroplasmin
MGLASNIPHLVNKDLLQLEQSTISLAACQDSSDGISFIHSRPPSTLFWIRALRSNFLTRHNTLLPTSIGSLWASLGPRSLFSPFRRPFLILENPTAIMAAETARVSPSIASSTSNGTFHKRKRPGVDGVKYYAVREGRKPGVYSTWEECLSQVKGHRGALCQSSPFLLYTSIDPIR